MPYFQMVLQDEKG